MANSKYEYVKAFERPDGLLPSTWMVVRLDGRGFTKMCAKYKFEKPNDLRGISLMNASAEAVMKEIPDIVLAYGVSDEFSFLFPRDCQMFQRRENKMVSTVVSTFTAYYIHLWPQFFSEYPISPPLPSFDGRAVLYPNVQTVRDYFSWRQVDCHINNLYNTTFWSLVEKGGLSNIDAESKLSGTVSSDKNEILFSQFGINYNNEPELYKKGSILYRELIPDEPQPEIAGQVVQSAPTTPGSGDDATTQKKGAEAPKSTAPNPTSKRFREKQLKLRKNAPLVTRHIDLIQDQFWEKRPWLLSHNGVDVSLPPSTNK